MAIAAVITAISVWSTEPPTQGIWVTRIAAPTVAITLAGLLFWNSTRREILPDLLAANTRSYFERDGFCFSITLAPSNGICWLQIYFQNRYANACQARVVLQPPYKSLSFSKLELAPVDVTIECEGASYGVSNIPWPILTSMQGRTVSLEVTAQTTYPGGRGKLMRLREGIRVGPAGGVLGAINTTARVLLNGS